MFQDMSISLNCWPDLHNRLLSKVRHVDGIYLIWFEDLNIASFKVIVFHLVITKECKAKADQNQLFTILSPFIISFRNLVGVLLYEGK